MNENIQQLKKEIEKFDSSFYRNEKEKIQPSILLLKMKRIN